jgi:osmotically-inducible protein OsmY
MKNRILARLLLSVGAPLALVANPANDRKIETAAEASYNYRTVLEDHVRVKAADGVVTLSGVVQDKNEKALAQDTVENLPGVTRVQNDIQVTPKYPENSDAWIAFQIRSRLLVKGGVSATGTTVAVQDGAVTLSGKADNLAQKELTEIYAKEIEGVKAVKNDLVLKDQIAQETIGETIDDASITTQVKYALLRHQATHTLKTKVVTNDGRIVITGEATSNAEKALVTKLAGDVRGAKSVSNGMTIKG